MTGNVTDAESDSGGLEDFGYSAFVYIGVILGLGLVWYFVKGRHHLGTLASHAADKQ